MAPERCRKQQKPLGSDALVFERACGRFGGEGIPLLQDHPWIDNTEAPLYVQVLPKEGTDEELRKFCNALRVWHTRVDFPFAVVFDISGLGFATAGQRRILAQHEKSVADTDRKYCAGCGLVAASTWQVGLITATFWLSPPAYPAKVFANREDAKAWAADQLAARVGKPSEARSRA